MTSPSLNKKSVILCVDDDKGVLLSLKLQLKSYYKDKYQYDLAYTADEAMTIIDHLISDGSDILLIISDWLLQGMRGDEFLIKVYQKYPHINTVLLTGHASDEVIENARNNANLLTCLNKPWILEDLIQIVNLANEKRHLP